LTIRCAGSSARHRVFNGASEKDANCGSTRTAALQQPHGHH
jgi:hypothetical protein